MSLWLASLTFSLFRGHTYSFFHSLFSFLEFLAVWCDISIKGFLCAVVIFMGRILMLRGARGGRGGDGGIGGKMRDGRMRGKEGRRERPRQKRKIGWLRNESVEGDRWIDRWKDICSSIYLSLSITLSIYLSGSEKKGICLVSFFLTLLFITFSYSLQAYKKSVIYIYSTYSRLISTNNNKLQLLSVSLRLQLIKPANWKHITTISYLTNYHPLFLCSWNVQNILM